MERARCRGCREGCRVKLARSGCGCSIYSVWESGIGGRAGLAVGCGLWAVGCGAAEEGEDGGCWLWRSTAVGL